MKLFNFNQFKSNINEDVIPIEQWEDKNNYLKSYIKNKKLKKLDQEVLNFIKKDINNIIIKEIDINRFVSFNINDTILDEISKKYSMDKNKLIERYSINFYITKKRSTSIIEANNEYNKIVYDNNVVFKYFIDIMLQKIDPILILAPLYYKNNMDIFKEIIPFYFILYKRFGVFIDKNISEETLNEKMPNVLSDISLNQNSDIKSYLIDKELFKKFKFFKDYKKFTNPKAMMKLNRLAAVKKYKDITDTPVYPNDKIYILELNNETIIKKISYSISNNKISYVTTNGDTYDRNEFLVIEKFKTNKFDNNFLNIMQPGNMISFRDKISIILQIYIDVQGDLIIEDSLVRKIDSNNKETFKKIIAINTIKKPSTELVEGDKIVISGIIYDFIDKEGNYLYVDVNGHEKRLNDNQKDYQVLQ